MSSVYYLIKEKISVGKNGIRILFVKYPLYFYTILCALVMVLYFLNQHIQSEFLGLKIAQHVNIFTMVQLYPKEVSILIFGISVSVLFLSEKSTIQFWNKTKQTPITQKDVFLSNVMVYAALYILILMAPLTLIMLALGISVTYNVFVLLILVALVMTNIMFSVALYKVLSSFFSWRRLFGYTICLSHGVTCILLFHYYKGNSISLRIFSRIDDMAMVVPSILLGVLSLLILWMGKDIELTFRDVHSSKAKYKKMSLFLNQMNVYSQNVVLETVRHTSIYLKLLGYSVVLILVDLWMLSNSNSGFLIYTAPAIMAASLGIYYSYQSVYNWMPLKPWICILWRMAFSGIVVLSLLLGCNILFPDGLTLSVIAEILLMAGILLMMELNLKMPLLVNGDENAVFYLLITLFPLGYNLCIGLVSALLSSVLEINVRKLDLSIIVFVMILVFSLRPYHQMARKGRVVNKNRRELKTEEE